MAQLTVSDIFGQGAVANVDSDTNTFSLTIDLNDFADASDGGQIQEGLGISDINAFATSLSQGNNAVALLYAMIILTSQNHAESLNDDPEQSIFISQGGKRFASGTRDGQIQRVINLNVFSDDLNGSNLPDIDQLSQGGI